MLSLLTENSSSQQLGAVLLIKTAHQTLVYLNLDFIVQMYHALPIRFKAIHLISFDDSSRIVGLRLFVYDDVFIHSQMRTTRHLASKLEEHGFRVSDLPQGLGGLWTLDRFHRWQELRTRMEWSLPLGLGHLEVEEALTYPGIREVTSLPDSEKKSVFDA